MNYSNCQTGGGSVVSVGFAEKQALQAIADSGIDPPENIIIDGCIHRFRGSGTGSQKNGWYKLYPDEPIAGSFGDWKLNISENWCSTGLDKLTPADRDRILKQRAAQTHARKLKQRTKQATAAHLARTIWDKSKPANPKHPYLITKQIKPHISRLSGDRLVIPVWCENGTLSSLQFIAPDGCKRFLTDGRIQGCYATLGKPDGDLIICEGFATAATLYELTGGAVAVAFNAGNLAPMAQIMRRKFPNKKITIAADNDRFTLGNPGIKKGREAAALINAYFAFPTFPDTNTTGTDFNDLHNHQQVANQLTKGKNNAN